MEATQVPRIDQALFSLNQKIQENPGEVAQTARNVKVAALAATALLAIAATFCAITAVAAFSATFGLSTLLLIPAVLLGAGAHASWVASRAAGIVAEEAEERTSNPAGQLFSAVNQMIGALPEYARNVKRELYSSPILSLIVDNISDEYINS